MKSISSLHRRGFTLVEIMVVSALIALLSGIAIFAINEMYNANIRKATIGEAQQFASALSFAQNDLQFYPRFNVINRSKSGVLLNRGADGYGSESLLPRIDYYGFITGTNGAMLTRVQNKWTGPYMGQSQTRNRSNRGGSSGLVKMRLPDLIGTVVNGEDMSIVDWPADVWGTPYVLYLLKARVESGLRVPEFIETATEDADFLNAVVSYGQNKVPGGNGATPLDYRNQTLFPGALFIEGDPLGDGSAQYTLKTAGATDPRVRIDNNPGNANYVNMIGSLFVGDADYSVDDGRVGMLQTGTDDIVYEF